jgi:hypothetical protein
MGYASSMPPLQSVRDGGSTRTDKGELTTKRESVTVDRRDWLKSLHTCERSAVSTGCIGSDRGYHSPRPGMCLNIILTGIELCQGVSDSRHSTVWRTDEIRPLLNSVTARYCTGSLEARHPVIYIAHPVHVQSKQRASHGISHNAISQCNQNRESYALTARAR